MSPVGRSATVLELLGEALAGRGFAAFGFLDPGLLPSIAAPLPARTSARYAIENAGLLVAVSIAYGRGWTGVPPGGKEDPDIAVRLGRFVRADWYGELVHRLGLVVDAARGALMDRGLPAGRRGDWRRLANSALPERDIALAAGLGRLGRSGLLLDEVHGPGVLIGILIVPREVLPDLDERRAEGRVRGDREGGGPVLRQERLSALHPRCADCGRCVAECPTGALGEMGTAAPVFQRDRCLQHWCNVPSGLPAFARESLAGLLYGCDRCVEACPLLVEEGASECHSGTLGPRLDARLIAERDVGELERDFRGTALGASFIDKAALRRNALLAIEAEAGRRPSHAG